METENLCLFDYKGRGGSVDHARVLDFDGDTYDKQKDQVRLSGLLSRVHSFMLDHHWHTLSDIRDMCGGSEASVSARLRDLRKEKFGGHTVERKRLEGGLWMYRLL